MVTWAGHVEVRGQLAKTGSLLPLCGFWESNSMIRLGSERPDMLSHLPCSFSQMQSQMVSPPDPNAHLAGWDGFSPSLVSGLELHFLKQVTLGGLRIRKGTWAFGRGQRVGSTSLFSQFSTLLSERMTRPTASGGAHPPPRRSGGNCRSSGISSRSASAT